MQEIQQGFRVHSWGVDPVLERWAVPRPGPGEVLVAVEACGVGLTVLNCIAGDLADDRAHLPRVPGHELVGRVTSAGPGAGSLLGRRVTAYFYLSCGECPPCMAGREPRCERLAGWVGVHRDGGYAPYTALPAFNVVPVDAALDPVALTVVPDALATSIHVCARRARLRPSDRVVVIGAGGGVGAHLVQVARLFGARVVGCDRTEAKLALLDRLGAVPVNSDDFSTVDATALWSEGAPTVVVDLVGSEESLAWATEALAPGGRLVVLTTFRNRAVHVDPRVLVFKEASVIASRYAARAEVAAAGQLLASGRVRPVVGDRAGPADLPRLHAALRSGELLGRGALVWR